CIYFRPEIYTFLDGEPFAFAIEDQFVPVKLSLDSDLPSGLTRFVFPFKTADSSVYKIIRQRLTSLGAEILLFLDNLNRVNWQTIVEEGSYACERSDPPYEWCDLSNECGNRN